MERIPQHDRLLPPGLVRLADLVREQLGWPAWSRHQLQQFALRGPVLKAISTHSDFSSAWAALAPGLEVAATGGHPDPCVWATGCWDCQRGLREVAGLNEKLHLAAEHGAKEFFLPASQQGEASQIVAGHGASPSVNPLRMGITEPREVLRPLLARLRACPPPANEDDEPAFQACIDSYNFQPLDDERTHAFYETHLLPTVAARLKRCLQERWPSWQPTHLVTIVSRRRELVLLAARALQVRHVLLFYTDGPLGNDQTDDMRHVCARLQTQAVQCTPVAFHDDPSLQDTLAERLAPFLKGVPADSVVVDLTPGTKLMSLCLAFAAPTGSWQLYLQHQTRPVGDRRPIPGTERYLRWQAGGGLR